jgi:hypothetical protein
METAYSGRGSIARDMPTSRRPSLFGRADTDHYLPSVCDNVKRHSSDALSRGNNHNLCDPGREQPPEEL